MLAVRELASVPDGYNPKKASWLYTVSSIEIAHSRLCVGKQMSYSKWPYGNSICKLKSLVAY